MMVHVCLKCVYMTIICRNVTRRKTESADFSVEKDFETLQNAFFRKKCKTEL